MKVLHVINDLSIGGAERLLVESLPLLRDSSVRVDLLLLNDRETFFKSKLTRVFTGNIFTLGNGNLYNPLYIFKLVKYLNNYDCVHAHLFPTFYYVSLAKMCTRSKVKLIFTEHNTVNNRINNWFFRLIDRFIYRKFAIITAISPQVVAMLKNQLKLKNRIEMISNGINLKSFESSIPYSNDEFFKESSKKILIQVSRFTVQKDQQTLIKSMQHLKKSIKLLLVGTGPTQEACQKLVEEYGLTDRVKFLGLRNDIPRLLKTCDIVIQSSNWEGFGLAAVEGMAAGKPVIASDVAGLNEVVKGAGLLFKVGDERDLCCQINNLVENETFYQELKLLCEKRAQEYDIKMMVSKFKKIYEVF